MKKTDVWIGPKHRWVVVTSDLSYILCPSQGSFTAQSSLEKPSLGFLKGAAFSGPFPLKMQDPRFKPAKNGIRNQFRSNSIVKQSVSRAAF